MMKLVSGHIVPFVCLTAFGLLLPSVAQSTTLAQLSLAQLVNSAQVVVHAKALGSSCVWRNGEIWTVTTFRVLENWKGSSAPEIKVWMIGGQINRIMSYVPGAPRFRPGEEVVLFLEPMHTGDLSITAWGEGTFRVRFDARAGEPRVTQDTAIVPEFDATGYVFQHSEIKNWPLRVLKLRVQEAERGYVQ